MKSKSGVTVIITKDDAYKEKTTNDELINGLERWRTVKTDKTKVVKGRMYYWCRHHVKDGIWNGMYVIHKPEYHKGNSPNAQTTTVVATLGNYGAAKKEDKSNGAATLQLQSKLKEVMCTNLCMSGDDVDKIFAQAKKN